MRRFVLSLTLLMASGATSEAVEVGDIIRLSSMGVTRTVTALSRPNRETVVMTVQVMDANATEHCQRTEDLPDNSPALKTCVQQSLSPPEQITVNCRTATIILEGQGGGAYRRSGKGGPWVSSANPNFVIQGDALFQVACNR
ncbi:hypothetical protein ACFOYU_13820 [Microvirga sp. GCM10011540]|uniref:hypothetical protein n=1 Tax=Microvirga sp. GCM10011540 TaxID=3317338 RepID=UPI00360DB3C4